MGLRNRACISVPEMASVMPTAAHSSTRGRRMWKNAARRPSLRRLPKLVLPPQGNWIHPYQIVEENAQQLENGKLLQEETVGPLKIGRK